MKKIGDVCLSLAKFQGQLFELANSQFKCSSYYFVKKFMNSSLAKRMDEDGFILESNDLNSCLEELIAECDLSLGFIKVDSNIMIWAGYLYRYWAYKYRMSSKQIFKIIKLDELEILYEAYHSLDIDEAINRIAESKNIILYSNLASQARIVIMSRKNR